MRPTFDFTKQKRDLPEIPSFPFPNIPFFAEDEESIETDALLSSVEERPQQPNVTLTLGDVLSELEGAMMDD